MPDGRLAGSGRETWRASVAHTNQYYIHWCVFGLVGLVLSLVLFTIWQIGVTLSSVEVDWAEFGSMLFIRSVSGTRFEAPSLYLTSVSCYLFFLHPPPHVPLAVFLSLCYFYLISCDRVVIPNKRVTIGPHTFSSWGSHTDSPPSAYLTAAAAIGMTKDEVTTFLRRLDKTLAKFRRKHAPDLRPLPSSLPAEDSQGLHHFRRLFLSSFLSIFRFTRL